MLVVLLGGCFEDTGPTPSSGTTPGQDETASTEPTAGDATTTETDPGTSTTPMEGTADETGSTGTGELPPPLCGDGIPVPGELCLGDTTVVMASGVPASARLGDVTSSSSADLVYLAMEQVVVHAGDGRGNFGAEIFDAAVAGERFELGDLDGDGVLDLVALESAGPLRVLLGSGSASFSSSDQATVGADPRALALGDLDGDGSLDVVVGTAASAELFVVLGGGDGTLSPLPAIAAGGEVHGVALADLDGDGNLDVAVARQGAEPGVAVALGDGSGGLLPPSPTPGQMMGAHGVVAGDLDGDGRPDLAYLSRSGDALGLLLADGAGSFQPEQVLPTGAEPSVLLAADLRDDGRDELVVGHGSENTLRIVAVEAGVPTELAQVMLVAATSALHAGDVNDDGVLDLAVTPPATEIVTLVLSTP